MMVSDPITSTFDDLTDALRSRGVAVLQAPAGSGKTTRVPLHLSRSLPGEGQTVVLEPRRLAARLPASYVAKQLQQRPGETVGYQVRFDSAMSQHTRVVYLTEGVFLRRLSSNPTLQGIDTVILDEFHERHIAADTALSMVQHLRQTSRPDLRLLVMSATLDTSPVAAHLGDATVIEAAGRQFPITIHHIPSADRRPLHRQIVEAVQQAARSTSDGHMLVFLPGVREIRRAIRACASVAADHDLQLLPLHGSLPISEQGAPFAPSNRRKVIFSTNIAETSVTVPGVTVVIDSGLAKVAQLAPWSGLPRLAVQPISQASAAQRAGRAGRTAPGRCLRLYTNSEIRRRPEHDTPEILRADLSDLLLRLQTWNVRRPDELPWLTSPSPDAWQRARDLLVLLGAMTPEGALTPDGQLMAQLPVHPRIGRLVIDARRRGAVPFDTIAGAWLSESFRLRVDEADQHHDRLGSDLLSACRAVMKAGNGSRQHHRATPAALRDVDLRLLDRAAKRLRVKVPTDQSSPPQDKETALLIATLAAFPDRVAKQVRPGVLALASGGSVKLWKESEAFAAPWVVVIDIEERGTQRGTERVARSASAIEPDWLLDLWPDAIQETRQLRWDSKHEQVMAREALVFQKLAIDESVRAAQPSPEVSELLFQAAAERGIDSWAPRRGLERLLAKVELMRGAFPEQPWPTWTQDIALETLRAACTDRTSFKQLKSLDLLAALRQALPHNLQDALRRHAPDRVSLPSGRSLEVHYEPGKPPWVGSRLQDFFGMPRGPTVADGRVALVLHLRAPNGRDAQITDDLAGFWDHTYREVRKELRRRYPKHAWPEDGRRATPPRRGRIR